MSRTSALILVVAVWATGCKPDPNAPQIFRSEQEYAAALTRVQELTKEPFEAMHEGHPLSDREKEGLREAERLIDSMIAFKADHYSTYILRGLTRRALDDSKGAMEAYEQGLKLKPANPQPQDKAAIGRIYDEVATLYFEQQQYEEAERNADEAVKLIPEDPSILTNAASVKIQLKKAEEATMLVDTALKVAPTYERARDLKKLLSFASKPK